MGLLGIVRLLFPGKMLRIFALVKVCGRFTGRDVRPLQDLFATLYMAEGHICLQVL